MSLSSLGYHNGMMGQFPSPSREPVRLSAPALGYRSFQWGGKGPLRSTGRTAMWPIQKRPFHARCLINSDKDHKAPVDACQCGLHAYSKPQDAQVEVGDVGAVVMGYDRLIIAPNGWRAATVELIALVAKKPHEPHGAVNASKKSLEYNGQLIAPGGRIDISGTPTRLALELLAKSYGVRVLDRWEDAVAIAAEYGAEPIPEVTYDEIAAWEMGPDYHDSLFAGWGGNSPEMRCVEKKLKVLFPWILPGMAREIQTSVMHSDPYGMRYHLGSPRSQPIYDCVEVTVEIEAPDRTRVRVDLFLTRREVEEME